MKLPIKKKYFDMIKSGEKTSEFRDAHITFVCEETGETLRKEILAVKKHRNLDGMYPDVLQDDFFIEFQLRKSWEYRRT